MAADEVHARRTSRPSASASRDSPVESVYIHAVYLINVASDDAEVRRKSLDSLTHALRGRRRDRRRRRDRAPGQRQGRSARRTTFKLIGEAFKAGARADRALSAAAREHRRRRLHDRAHASRSWRDVIERVRRRRPRSASASTRATCSRRATRCATPTALEQVVDECDREVGLDRLRCLHLNDSKTPLGSNRDRHANLGEGELGEDGIRVFLGEPRFKGLPVLLEVPGPDGHGPDKGQIEIAKRLRPRRG